MKARIVQFLIKLIMYLIAISVEVMVIDTLSRLFAIGDNARWAIIVLFTIGTYAMMFEHPSAKDYL